MNHTRFISNHSAAGMPQRDIAADGGAAEQAALLGCIGVRPHAADLVRETARLAAQLHCAWHMVYVETPALQALPSAQRERILNTLKLARDLGATTAVLSGHDVAETLLAYARRYGIQRLVLGRTPSAWWQRWHATTARRLAVMAPDLDLFELGHAPDADRAGDATGAGAAMPETRAPFLRRWRHVAAAFASVLTAVVAAPLQSHLDLVNIVMLFLLTVVLVAVRLGRGPAVVATFVGVGAFDFFFVPPRFSLAVSDLQYSITFAVMLVVGLITSQLTAGLRYQARVASHREQRARALYEFARELSSALKTEQIFALTANAIQRSFRVRATLLVPDASGRLLQPAGGADAAKVGVFDLSVAQWAFDRAEPAGMGTNTLPGNGFFYLPLVAPMRTRGVLVIQPESRRWILIPEQRQHLDTFATLAAITLERVHYIDVASDALLKMESERLRNSLLSALSHDLRTPLTSLVGLSESLAMSRPALSASQHDLALALRDEALRMSKLVANLLDMARIESGAIRLNLQWQPIEEVVGSSLRACRTQLASHQVRTQLAADLPLVNFDAMLIERVLCNLIENAAKYTPVQSLIEIMAEVRAGCLAVSVHDNGPGLPRGQEEALFEKFARGDRESATPGVGLGLSICRAIIHAHGGTIRAGRSASGGACFVFTLPLGTPPALPEVEQMLVPLPDDFPKTHHD